MSDDRTFLARWSRLKRERPADRPPSGQAQAAPASGAPSDAVATVTDTDIDLTTLPAIDAITAETDITGFLRRGVPPELTREALRRAWLVDPNIRNFVGIAENQWDFTKPDAIYGFGPLQVSDDVAELVRQALGCVVVAEMPVEAASNAAPSNQVIADEAG